MVAELRRRYILKTLQEKGVLFTHDIMKHCKVSEITIRRDLADLEQKGMLVRTHGGAVKSDDSDLHFIYDVKINKNKKDKDQICKIAAKFIKSNDIIFIDCGTTLSFLTKYITNLENLMVITNSLPVVSDLISYPNIKVTLIGGEVASERRAIYGPIAGTHIDKYHATKAFIGADGISISNGLSSYDEKEAAITLKMVENSDEVFLLCDSSKIEKNSFVSFAPITHISHLITDKLEDKGFAEKCNELGISVITSASLS